MVILFYNNENIGNHGKGQYWIDDHGLLIWKSNP